MLGEQESYDLAAAAEFAGTPQSSTGAALGPSLLTEFVQAELERRETELRWLQDLRQYRGQYDPEVLAQIGNKRSRAFVRKTRVKVKTVDSRVADLLVPSGTEKNWEIDSTPVPTLPEDQKQAITQALMQKSGGQMPPKEVLDQAFLESAKASSKKMAKVIEDQLVEARYKKTCLAAMHSAHIFGTGIVKGPLIEMKVRTQFVHDGQRWAPKAQSYITPFIDFVPLWRFYPDMSATSLEDARYCWERHIMSKSELAKLATRKSFDAEKIKDYITSNPQGLIKSLFVDNELKIIGDRAASQNVKAGQFEVLERWGWLDGHQLQEAGVVIPPERLHESFFSNAWVLPNGDLIKAVLQPINGVTWPYHLYYFDKDETSIFGEGLSAILRDDQTMINAAARMMLDNAAITAGTMLEVSPGLLTSMENVTEVHAWKVWLRNATNPGQAAVKAIELPSKLNELASLKQMFDAHADEVSAIPPYMTGESVNTGAAGTASGMSMLMGAANIVIKDLISAWDEGISRPFITSLYRWNMQFHNDPTIKGDFDVKARGTASLVAKEVRAQQLNNFAAMTANELDAPFIKRDKLLRQRAEANELSDVVKTEEEVAQETNSEQIAQQQQMQQQMQQMQMDEAKAKIDKMLADAQRVMAQAEQVKAQSVATKVSAAYAAMQAAGTAVSSPLVAPAADEILRSSGWVDATPDNPIADVAPEMGAPVNDAMGAPMDMPMDMPMDAQQMPSNPMSPMSPMSPMDGQDVGAQVGEHAGFETPTLSDNA